MRNRDEKYSRPSPRGMSDIIDMTSRSPTPNIPRTPTSMSQTGHDPIPSTSSYSIPGPVTPRLPAVKLYDRKQGFQSAHKETQGDKREDQGIGKIKDIQETMLLLLKKLEENVRELKEDVGFIKNRIDVNPKCDANATVENPFEILRSFGFRADSFEEAER
ncbi:uncharacterized protein LOC123500574 isoform X2 [Portunus trituberculatus]|uniref:uncharacterized protein LOC123500574 isoform X2 n=1 Tax=Portunus trituberculatus TaxID=210409 RepID=UPI001E1D1EFF|nr:uncharacterized protein LOC123500574 isoform X2 [Portunus trituberculatus]XP_045105197.1 uncharacterized protein LOC123500574 isoform X2 [Portunus trituberculatus]